MSCWITRSTHVCEQWAKFYSQIAVCNINNLICSQLHFQLNLHLNVQVAI